MVISKVKNQFHTLIDEVENPDLLRSFFLLFKARIKEPEAQLWKSLSEIEQAEVLAAYNESNNEANLVSNKTVKEKYDRWLKK